MDPATGEGAGAAQAQPVGSVVQDVDTLSKSTTSPRTAAADSQSDTQQVRLAFMNDVDNDSCVDPDSQVCSTCICRLHSCNQPNAQPCCIACT